MLLTWTLLVNWEKELSFFSSRTLRVSFNTPGQGAELNSAMRGNNKSEFEGNTAVALSVPKVHFLHIRTWSLDAVSYRLLSKYVYSHQVVSVGALSWTSFCMRDASGKSSSLPASKTTLSLSKKYFEEIVIEKFVLWDIRTWSQTYCTRIFMLLHVVLGVEEKNNRNVTDTSVMLSPLQFTVASLCICW